MSLGHPRKFRWVSSVGFVTAPTSVNRGQPNFARCFAVSFAAALYTVSQKRGATLTMATTLSILDRFAKFFTAAKSSKFPTKLILGYPPHLKYVAALRWKI